MFHWHLPGMGVPRTKSGFGGRKRHILRCQNLKILLAGPIDSQYLGSWTSDTKIHDLGTFFYMGDGRIWIGGKGW